MIEKHAVKKIYERWSTHALVDTQTDKKPGTTRKVGGLEANLQAVVKHNPREEVASEANYLSVVKNLFENPTDPTKVQSGLLRIKSISLCLSTPFKTQNQSLCKLIVNEWIGLLHASNSTDPGLAKSLTGGTWQYSVGVWIKQ